ncbi:MAG: ribosomal RNA small subunit methyltransferase A [Candidatus Fermentibacteraceae bacterium]|nr:ribosomal RNA small subunit methyltransferase A [Candidatus Fermentibacteraceae bacterium]MBN2609023.1 ribosomal RNA small subunit methyltransferase A [Candidatus Fermentibacteraceae bacterium]
MMLLPEVRRNLNRLGLRPDRDLGQNFLVNPSIARKIAAAVPEEGSTMEIGPGLGSLTEQLLNRCGSLTAVEISARMSDFLKERFSGRSLTVVHGDFLKLDPSAIPGFPFSTIAGNLPYSISSPILFRLLEDGFRHVTMAVIMLQREVAQRLAALDGGRDYGKLSLQIWPLFTVEVLLDAIQEDFFPPPEVRSRVLVLNRRSEPLASGDTYSRFRRLVKVSFAKRRKTIFNNLKTIMNREEACGLLSSAGVDPDLRAEQVPPDRFLAMAEAMS